MTIHSLNNYPSGKTDEEIQQMVKEFTNDIAISAGNINAILQLAPLIQLGQNEIQKRIVEKSAKTADKAQRNAMYIAGFSVILSFVAIGFSYAAFKSDENWQKEETQLLNEIKQEIKIWQDVNNATNEILNEIKMDLEKLKESATIIAEKSILK